MTNPKHYWDYKLYLYDIYIYLYDEKENTEQGYRNNVIIMT